MQIAAQHSKRQGVAGGIGVVEGFFLHGVDLHARDISGRGAKLAVGVEANAADAAAAGKDPTAMPAGQALNLSFLAAYYKLRRGGHGAVG
jgi:hypothetical protein